MTTDHRTLPARTRLEPLAAPRTRQMVGVVTFAVLTALGAKLAVPIGGTAVPFTFQVLAVLLSGALLGPRLGAASQVTYLAAGMAGLPVFATGSIFGPSGGYLMAFPVAAFVVGLLATGGMLRNLGALLAGVGVIYAGGVAWLSILTGPSTALLLGVVPFVAADLVKVVLAAIVTYRLRDRARSLFAA